MKLIINDIFYFNLYSMLDDVIWVKIQPKLFSKIKTSLSFDIYHNSNTKTTLSNIIQLTKEYI